MELGLVKEDGKPKKTRLVCRLSHYFLHIPLFHCLLTVKSLRTVLHEIKSDKANVLLSGVFGESNVLLCSYHTRQLLMFPFTWQ